MSSREDDYMPEEHYVSKAWLKKHGSGPIPEGDILHIIDPFVSGPTSTSADPKLSPPPFTYDTLKKTIALLNKEQIIRFEVNLKLFNQIVDHIVHDIKPKFTFINERTVTYNDYDRIPVIFVPGQKEQLKIIKKGGKIEDTKTRKSEREKDQGNRDRPQR